jgi:hypothetical protein
LQLIAASEDFICYVIKNNIRVIHSATGGRALLKLEPAGTKPQDMHMYSTKGGLSLLACVTTAGDLIIWRLFNMGLEGGRYVLRFSVLDLASCNNLCIELVSSSISVNNGQKFTAVDKQHVLMFQRFSAVFACFSASAAYQDANIACLLAALMLTACTTHATLRPNSSDAVGSQKYLALRVVGAALQRVVWSSGANPRACGGTPCAVVVSGATVVLCSPPSLR